MAKKKRGRKGRMPAALKAYWASHKRGARTRKRSKGRRGRRGYSVSHVVHRNAPLAVKGLLLLPSMQEILAAAVGGAALPTVTRVVSNLLPIPMLKTGLPNVALEFVIGSAAAAAAQKAVNPTWGKILMILATARATQRGLYQLSGGVVGLADGAENPGLNAYADETMDALPMLDDGPPQLGADGETDLLNAVTDNATVSQGL